MYFLFSRIGHLLLHWLSRFVDFASSNPSFCTRLKRNLLWLFQVRFLCFLCLPQGFIGSLWFMLTKQTQGLSVTAFGRTNRGFLERWFKRWRSLLWWAVEGISLDRSLLGFWWILRDRSTERSVAWRRMIIDLLPEHIYTQAISIVSIERRLDPRSNSWEASCLDNRDMWVQF